MKKDILIIAGAALAAWWLLSRKPAEAAPKYWVTSQGNTAFPAEMLTGAGVAI